MATSTPQPSMSNGMQPSEATQSTISSAGCLAASIAWRMAAMSLTTPEAVSTCTTSTALMVWAVSRLQALLEGGRIDGAAPVALQHLDLDAQHRAISPQPSAKRPLSSASTVSPRESTLVSAASQPPWPLAA